MSTGGSVATHALTYGGNTYTWSYTYDFNGNITKITRTDKNTGETKTVNYAYDSANQLTREDNEFGGFTYTWTYDAAGNILRRREYAYTTGTLGTVLDSISYSYNDDKGWGDLLTSYDGKSITYDDIGNPLTFGSRTYTWEHGRQLATLTENGTTWSYTYNADGMRTKRTNGTDTYTYAYVGGQLMKMKRGSEQLAFAYDAEGVPLTVRVGSVYYFYVTNIQGDVIAILDQNGVEKVAYTYDAWGNLLSTTGSMADTLGAINPLRYRGYVYDSETGLYYLQSRYYDPQIGRWISPEPNVYDGEFDDGAGLLSYNVYTYCANSPVINRDSTGEYVEQIAISKVAIILISAGLALGATIILFRAHRTLKNGSKARTNDKHTKPRPGRNTEKKKQNDNWKKRK